MITKNRISFLMLFIILGAMNQGLFLQSAWGKAEQKTLDNWIVRCNGTEPANVEEKRGKCEIFQRLVFKQNGKRLMEFAIGFPASKDVAHGIVILPLGMRLEEGARLQVDDGPVMKFKVRYCLADGCYAYLSLNDNVLDQMRKGKDVGLMFSLGAKGEKKKVLMSLKGFTKALRAVS